MLHACAFLQIFTYILQVVRICTSNCTCIYNFFVFLARHCLAWSITWTAKILYLSTVWAGGIDYTALWLKALSLESDGPEFKSWLYHWLARLTWSSLKLSSFLPPSYPPLPLYLSLSAVLQHWDGTQDLTHAGKHGATPPTPSSYFLTCHLRVNATAEASLVASLSHGVCEACRL